MLNRRSFLATAGVLVAGTMCRGPAAESQGSIPAALARRQRLERIGIQLYTVRAEMQRDADDTLRRLAEIGYREVEFAGYFNHTPAQTRELMQRHGLASPSTHIGYELIASGWDRALDDAAARGHTYVTIPWLPADARRSAATWRGVAAAFNRAGKAAHEHGLRFAYHNHDFEFAPVDGEIPFDLLLRNTDPSLVSFQMDVYWLVKSGGDPLAYMRAHPRRFTMLHVKDSAGAPSHTQVDVGAGLIDFASIIRMAMDQKSLQHVFVEHDQPADPMAFAKASFDHLRTMEF